MNRDRKHIRLTDWDYSSEGIYFITICCRDRQSFFGKIEDNRMILSEIGLIASQYWLEIPDHFPHVKSDEFVTMPNHIHGIIILDYSLAGTRHGVSLQTPTRGNVGSCHGMTHSINNQFMNYCVPKMKEEFLIKLLSIIRHNIILPGIKYYRISLSN